MVIGGKEAPFKIIRILALGLLIFLPFQNCGQDFSSQNEAYYTGSDFENSECLSAVVDCGPSDEFLQISIDLENPSSFKGLSTANIVGRCNTGNYPAHSIYWEIRNSATTPVASGNEASACVDGKYSIVMNIASLNTGVSYSIYVKIIGVDTDGQRYHNVQANGTAEIDITK